MGATVNEAEISCAAPCRAVCRLLLPAPAGCPPVCIRRGRRQGRHLLWRCKSVCGGAGAPADGGAVRGAVRHFRVRQRPACDHTGGIRRHAGGRDAILGIYGPAAELARHGAIHCTGLQVFLGTDRQGGPARLRSGQRDTGVQLWRRVSGLCRVARRQVQLRAGAGVCRGKVRRCACDL